MAQTRPIPEGYRTVTPHLVVRGADAAIALYAKAFGAEALGRMKMPGDERLMHAVIRIGDSLVMLVDEFPEMKCLSPQSIGGSAMTLHLYVPDVDQAVARALAAGCTLSMPVADMFWGDRYGRVTDPFGHAWSLATHVRDVPPAEMAEAAAKAFKGA